MLSIAFCAANLSISLFCKPKEPFNALSHMMHGIEYEKPDEGGVSELDDLESQLGVQCSTFSSLRWRMDQMRVKVRGSCPPWESFSRSFTSHLIEPPLILKAAIARNKSLFFPRVLACNTTHLVTPMTVYLSSTSNAMTILSLFLFLWTSLTYSQFYPQIEGKGTE